MKKKQKLWALLHDGTFQGDSAFYCPGSEVEYKGQTFKQLRQEFLKQELEQNGIEGEDEEDEEDIYEPTGAWIVTEEHKDIIDLVWESDPGNDSAVYNCNYIAKKIAHHLAIKHLGEKAK